MEIPNDLEEFDRGQLPLSLGFEEFLGAIDTFPEEMPFPSVVVAMLESLRSAERIREDREKQEGQRRNQSDTLSCSVSIKSDDSNEKRKLHSLTDVPHPEEFAIHKINPRQFLADFAHLFDTTKSEVLAGGLVVIAKTPQASVVYADNVYNSSQPEKDMVLWTDASWNFKNPRQLACSAIAFKQVPHRDLWCDEIAVLRGPRNAPFELFGIHQALKAALRRYPQTANQEVVQVFTDCQRAMNEILSPDKDQGADTQALLEAINCLAKRLVERGCRIELHWVKAHDSVIGNERVDALASSARRIFRQNHKYRWIPTYLEFEELSLKAIFPKQGTVTDRKWQEMIEEFSSSYVFSGRRLIDQV
ncbi:hypothetical protein PFICI_06114 [Pestalotiopsis fici W106-1]|uniref:RNase H type-1 domain-containing protein n=1 Tax=Pestalotiopsis fici (strain W106-1 / CGMCC3.15140) TaxID=1229662 RepID=W3X6S9_PESFW|nr:uncharacterized protein PFICI_06114 [Pestalotiopsis fici W106-1]ETS81112.1 hypothetical protein PFICI_06114 [Pestalotiopsis fici W106-1]